jgi:diaminopropionate ammonia-lyase
VTETRILRNPLRQPIQLEALGRATIDFHRRMPAYSPTLLVNAPSIAEQLGVGRVLLKAETQRLGLPSFKILGASWATYRSIADHLGYDPEPWRNINQLARERLAHLRPFSLAAATDGNHGRAVAFMARLLGFEARIFVPEGTVAARIAAIQNEGAELTIVAGDYDAAVKRAAEEAGDRCLVISDTSWPGYEATPTRVIEGYSTIFAEIDDALTANGLSQPDAVIVPVGVGALMAAAVRAYRCGPGDGPVLIGVEPGDANCVLASAAAGHLVTVPGPHRSIMVGLNCGTPSPLAFPSVSAGTDAFVSMDDIWAKRAMCELADAGVVAGETGAAALGGLRAMLAEESGRSLAAELGLGRDSTVLLLCTEGATDPENYATIVGRRPEQIGTIMTAAHLGRLEPHRKPAHA